MTQSPYTLKLSGALAPQELAVVAPGCDGASVANVKLKRRPGYFCWATATRRTRSLITCCVWPPSISKSIPIRLLDA